MSAFTPTDVDPAGTAESGGNCLDRIEQKRDRHLRDRQPQFDRAVSQPWVYPLGKLGCGTTCKSGDRGDDG
jgi:hypothetical protein